jgi:vacuolar-type H+-ATPase subunit I/STV1
VPEVDVKKFKELVDRLRALVPETAAAEADEVMAEVDSGITELAASGGGSESLQKANRDMLREIKTLKQRLKSEHGDDSARVSELEDQIKELTGDYEAKIQKLTTEKTVETGRLTKEQKKLQESLAQIQGAHSRSVVERELTDALVKGNVPVEHLPALKALLGMGAQVSIEGEVSKAVVNGKALVEHVTEFLASDAGKHYVRAPGSTGGGASGSGSGGAGGAKTLTRAQESSLTPDEKAAFYKGGGKLTD